MKMLPKIALIVSILACAGALYITYQFDLQRKDLHSNLVSTKDTLATTQKDLASTKGELATTKDTLKTTEQNLATTQEELGVEKLKVSNLETERDNLVAEKTQLETSLAEVKDKLATTDDELRKAREVIAINNPEEFARLRDEVASLKAQQANLAGEKEILAASVKSKENKINELEQEIVLLKTTPKNLRGQVVLAQPEWGFLILNVGHKDRVQPDTEFIVYRGDQLVTKVKVVDVKEGVSVAKILDGFNKVKPQAGDTAVF